METSRIFKFTPMMELDDGYHLCTITIGQGRKTIGILTSTEYICDSMREAWGAPAEPPTQEVLSKPFTAEVVFVECDDDLVVKFRDEAGRVIGAYFGEPCNEPVKWAAGFDFWSEVRKGYGED